MTETRRSTQGTPQPRTQVRTETVTLFYSAGRSWSRCPERPAYRFEVIASFTPSARNTGGHWRIDGVDALDGMPGEEGDRRRMLGHLCRMLDDALRERLPGQVSKVRSEVFA